MVTVKISLNSIDKVKSFVNDLTKFDSDFDLVSGRYVIDAKSIMGIFSLDLSKPLILNAVTDDEELIKELTEIIYIDTQNIDNEKLLNDVLTYKHKEKLYNRRDEILKRLEENISKDEQDILQFELNQIIIEISRLKS